jgi:predicted transcriptional regulator
MAGVFRPSHSGPASVLGPLEGEIMEIIWSRRGALSVGDVQQALGEQGRPLSDSAVRAVLNNLAGKGRLTKSRAGKITFFAAAASRSAFEAQVVSDVVGALKRNFGSEVIAEFVDQLAVDEETVAEFERLLARRRSELKS